MREGDAELPIDRRAGGEDRDPARPFRTPSRSLDRFVDARDDGEEGPTPSSRGEAEAIQHAALDKKIALVTSGIQAESQ
ncbi:MULTISPECIES: hypothetical protein [Methylobacteriaceae]|uniref:hypothetical protein n=1 Tax=Methylobacteriaceae TaxID=119045 RepID=UPI002F3519B4